MYPIDREDGFKMTMRAVVKIPKGKDITHSYSEPMDFLLTRKALLRMGKFFEASAWHMRGNNRPYCNLLFWVSVQLCQMLWCVRTGNVHKCPYLFQMQAQAWRRNPEGANTPHRCEQRRLGMEMRVMWLSDESNCGGRDSFQDQSWEWTSWRGPQGWRPNRWCRGAVFLILFCL